MTPYLPDTLPLKNLDLIRLLPEIGPANAALACYDGLLQSCGQSGGDAVAAERVRAMMTLYEDMKCRIAGLTRSQHAIAVLDTLFDRPIFQSADFVQRSGIPKQPALPFLRSLREAGVLQVLRESSGRRSAVLAFRELLNCAEGREIL